jgi:hypothetical protein
MGIHKIPHTCTVMENGAQENIFCFRRRSVERHIKEHKHSKERELMLGE